MRTRSVFSFDFGVFDVDGTLVDSIPFCSGIFADVVGPLGVPRDIAEEFYHRTTGQPMRVQYRTILAQHGVAAPDDLVESLRRSFDRRFVALDVPWFPKARRALADLRRKGVTLFLSSAAPDAAVWKRLASGNAARHFTVGYGSSAVPKGRRHVELFAEAASIDLADLASRAFFCGDSETDMQIARECGLHAIGVRGTVSDERLLAAGAERLVTSVGDLLSDPRRSP